MLPFDHTYTLKGLEVSEVSEKEDLTTTYEPYQIKTLEASAETLRDPKLLREVHDLEKSASRGDPDASWEGRAVARGIMSGITFQEAKERLQHFLESKRVASLNLGEHRTGTLREVEARTLTDYLARAIESKGQREHRHSINLAAREHHGRLVSDFEKAQDYYAMARELASEAHSSEPQFTDKEKINLEIYAERQPDPTARDLYLSLAQGVSERTDREDHAAWETNVNIQPSLQYGPITGIKVLAVEFPKSKNNIH